VPNSTCHTCGGDYAWTWQEAFNKFGFGDGEHQVMTETVAKVLRAAGYTISVEPWGLHNVVIDSITLNGVEQIPFDTITFGYDDPNDYLPQAIVTLLDTKLPAHGEIVS
jgi:hypothetical protein